MTVPHSEISVTPTKEASASDEVRDQHWQSNLRITGLLLGVWFLVTFVLGFYARELDFSFFGWPFSFWVAAQGALIAYIAIIGFYAWYMNRLDRRAGDSQDD